MKRTLSLLVLCGVLCAAAPAQDIPRIEKQDGRFALMMDGKPYLMLGAQINNSSSWAATLPAAWQSLEAMHANTVEAPVYWEQMEPAKGSFDFTNVDLLINGARQHHLHLVLLWFGTWKNGQNHYVPEWVKDDLKTYPREENAWGKLLDVMSPVGENTLAADKTAFAALMRHVKEVDAAQRTVIMVQVENESGSVGSVRDFSPAAQKLFESPVPAEFARAMHLGPGTWSRVFGADADESFEAYMTASYINAVAAAGKAEYPLPMYCNVWIAYPVHALENRDRPSAGQEYPSGGPQQANIAIWKAAAPSIDVLAPDFYSSDSGLFRQVLATYERPDNAVLIPETNLGADFGRYFFYALGNGAIGFSPFGIDRGMPQGFGGGQGAGGERPANPSENYALFGPADAEIAKLNFDGMLRTAVEEKGAARQTMHLPTADAVVSFGFPQSDGAAPTGTATLQGRAMVAQMGPLDFLVTGFDASVRFTMPEGALKQNPNQQMEIMRAEEGSFVDGKWMATRILNGDQTDRGLNFRGASPGFVRIRLHVIPLYDEETHRLTPQ